MTRDEMLLHIYPQGQWHDDAVIVGTPAALTELRDALDMALEHGAVRIPLEYAVQTEHVFTGDGEGYLVHVACLDGDEMQRVRLPYTDEVARDRREDKYDPR